MARLGEALSAAESERTATPWTIAAIRLLVLTGARLSEILTLRWEFVDFERGLLLLPDSKTGRKAITLNAPALKVLAKIPRLPDNPFVICGERRGAHLVNLEKPWRRIRAAAGLEGVRLHDLRHTFASVAAAGGASLPLIGNLLGHSQPGTTARYAHLSADPVRQVSEDTGRRIAQAMNPVTSAEIIPITKSQALKKDRNDRSRNQSGAAREADWPYSQEDFRTLQRAWDGQACPQRKKLRSRMPR